MFTSSLVNKHEYIQTSVSYKCYSVEETASNLFCLYLIFLCFFFAECNESSMSTTDNRVIFYENGFCCILATAGFIAGVFYTHIYFLQTSSKFPNPSKLNIHWHGTLDDVTETWKTKLNHSEKSSDQVRHLLVILTIYHKYLVITIYTVSTLQVYCYIWHIVTITFYCYKCCCRIGMS